MTKTILMGASFLAILASFPAFAADTKVNANAETSVGAKIENNMEKAGAAIERGTDKAVAKTKEAYADVKAYFDDEKNISATTSVNVGQRLTANELIGTDVQNPKGEKIGKIEDILIDGEGDAETVIINDNGVLGLGKLVAFDYDVIEGFTKDKDAVVKLSEKSINAAKGFDYKDTNGGKTTTIPAGQYSVSKLLKSKVIDANGKAVADVDTIAFDGDDADYLVVTFNKILGMGGDKAALNLEALDIVEADGKYSFKLNQAQTAEFNNAKATTKAN